MPASRTAPLRPTAPPREHSRQEPAPRGRGTGRFRKEPGPGCGGQAADVTNPNTTPTATAALQTEQMAGRRSGRARPMQRLGLKFKCTTSNVFNVSTSQISHRTSLYKKKLLLLI